MKKLQGTRSRVPILCLFVALTLICSGSLYAQDLINHQLNGNNTPSSWWGTATNAGAPSGVQVGGQIYRGEGAGYSPYWVPQPVTAALSAQTQCTNALQANAAYYLPYLTPTQISSIAATAGSFQGGILSCTTAAGGVPGTSNTSGWIFAGDWSNFQSTVNLTTTVGGVTTPAESQDSTGGLKTTTIPNFAPAGTAVEAEQCTACHGHNNATYGGSYLMTGHKNGFRKYVPNETFHSSDGTTYTGVNFSATSQPTVSGGTNNGKNLFYTTAGWMTPGGAPDAAGVQGANMGCAYCHTAGYNPVSASDASLWLPTPGVDGATGLFSWIDGGTNQVTNPGPEPTQVIPVAGTITGITVNTAGGTNPSTASVTFTTSAATGLPAGSVVMVNGLTSATGVLMNGTPFVLASAASTTGFTATPQIPDAYYPLATVASGETGTMTQLAPLSSTLLPRAPENMASGSGDSSWYLTGVTCERCHVAQVGSNTEGSNIARNSASGALSDQYSVGHEYLSVPNGTTSAFGANTPFAPTGTQATALCMECHRSQVISTGAKAIGLVYPPVAKATSTSTTTATYGEVASDYQTPQFLNSPHAEFMGTATMNQQNSVDLSLYGGPGGVLDATQYNATLFTGQGGAATGINSGCTGCHDPHQTIVGSEFTGQPLASSSIAIQNANQLQPASNKTGTTTPNPTTNSNLNWARSRPAAGAVRSRPRQITATIATSQKPRT